MIDRDNAVASAKTARTLLASVLVTAPAPLREQLSRIPRDRRATQCAALPCPRRADRQTPVVIIAPPPTSQAHSVTGPGRCKCRHPRRTIVPLPAVASRLRSRRFAMASPT